MSAEPAPRRGIWWWQAALLTASIWVTSAGAALLTALLRRLRHGIALEQAWKQLQYDPIALSSVQMLAVAVALGLGFLIAGRTLATRESLALHRPRASSIACAYLVGLCLQLVLAEVANLSAHFLEPPSVEQQQWLERMMSPRTLSGGFVALWAFVVVPSVSEELFFRGFLQRQLRLRYGFSVALALSAACFGISHGVGPALVYATLAGVILGTVAEHAQSSWVNISMHAGVNSLPLLLPEELIAIPGFNASSDARHHIPMLWLAGAGTFALLLLWRLHQLLKDELEHAENLSAPRGS